MAYDNNLSGVLFQSNKKGNDKAPTHYGKCEIDGKTYEIAGWRGSKDGKPYISLKFQVPRATKVAGDDDTRQRNGAQSMGDDIDF